MKRIFKIKTKSEPDLSNQYPSERRYSASIVLGLSTVLMQFGLCSILMGVLLLHKMSVIADMKNNLDENEKRLEEESYRRITDKLQRDYEYSSNAYFHYYVNIPALISAGCFIMAFGNILAFITGLFAWKRWYIDHNITFFFLSCSFSTLTCCICFLISVLTSANMKFDTYEDYEYGLKELSPLSLPLAINIIVLSFMGAVWSFLSTKVAYQGMRNTYPDDMMVTRRGKIQVSTIMKGNQNNISNIPREVINNFAIGNMVKYLPKVENHNLPKEESKDEYRQRVDKFLNAEPDLGKGDYEGKKLDNEHSDKLEK